MSELQRYESDAKYLASKIVTHWETYDFNETSTDPEERVPRITFDNVRGISVKPRVAEYINGFVYEKFLRKYDVDYKDGKYIIIITVEVSFAHVCEYKVTILLCTEAEPITLFSSRLERI